MSGEYLHAEYLHQYLIDASGHNRDLISLVPSSGNLPTPQH